MEKGYHQLEYTETDVEHLSYTVGEVGSTTRRQVVDDQRERDGMITW